MSFINRYNREISIVTITLVLSTLSLTPAKAEYDPELGRFMQRDPYQTAMTLTNVLLRNAQTQAVLAELAARGQYTDGMNLYQYARSNPLNLRDPSGELILMALLLGAALARISHWAYRKRLPFVRCKRSAIANG